MPEYWMFGSPLPGQISLPFFEFEPDRYDEQCECARLDPGDVSEHRDNADAVQPVASDFGFQLVLGNRRELRSAGGRRL